MAATPVDVTNIYEAHFTQGDSSKRSLALAAEAAATAYVDGRPKRRGKHTVTAAQRDADFWSCAAWRALPAELWRSDLMTLALARYFVQEKITNIELLSRIAVARPAALSTAVRRSRLALRPESAHRRDLESMAGLHGDIAELCRVLHIFGEAHRVRVDEVARLQRELADTTPFELLVLASLYAFEHLVPTGMSLPHRPDGTISAEQCAWHAINDVLLWKLGTARPPDLHLDQRKLARSLETHLIPVLSESSGAQAWGQGMRDAFHALLEAQIELNAFLSRSADAFSFDDGIRFVRRGGVLEIEVVDAGLRAAWERDGRKLARLHAYWFYRAADEFMRSPQATQTIGRPENHEANRLAYLRAIRTRLQLTEVYGVAATVTTDAGDEVDLFLALLSLELTSAFFQRDFLEAFMAHLRESGDWRVALRRLADGGMRQGFQIRYPLTWSDRSAKISNIVGWTVTPARPEGSALMAARILDFWTSDWPSLAAKVRASASASADDESQPELFERPFLKFGSLLVQLPWLVGVQNNSTAAINNLRRLGQRRGEFRAETERIEANVARALEARGFSVRLNWTPDRTTHGDAGEVDVVCVRDGVVLVMEVKSTFLRMSQREAWHHATSTLRKAGGQLKRKVDAVTTDLAGKRTLAEDLGAALPAHVREVHGWIVDTSIECDHQRFSGFLKVSLEEVLIALRDDRELLHDPDGLLGIAKGTDHAALYPDGFSCHRFVQVIENQSVWDNI